MFKSLPPLHFIMIGVLKRLFQRVLSQLFRQKSHVKLGLYGPPNSGKTSLANRICKDWLGEEMGSASPIPHETREVMMKEKIHITSGDKELTFNLLDTPGIATKIDYEDFLKHKMSVKEAKERAKEATRGVIEAIKWLDSMDCVLVVLDATLNPYSQVNITIIGNLAARDIPVLIVANKVDLKKANVKRIEAAFPQYPVVGVSAEKGTHVDKFYKEVFKLVKARR